MFSISISLSLISQHTLWLLLKCVLCVDKSQSCVLPHSYSCVSAVCFALRCLKPRNTQGHCLFCVSGVLRPKFPSSVASLILQFVFLWVRPRNTKSFHFLCVLCVEKALVYLYIASHIFSSPVLQCYLCCAKYFHMVRLEQSHNTQLPSPVCLMCCEPVAPLVLPRLASISVF